MLKFQQTVNDLSQTIFMSGDIETVSCQFVPMLVVQQQHYMVGGVQIAQEVV